MALSEMVPASRALDARLGQLDQHEAASAGKELLKCIDDMVAAVRANQGIQATATALGGKGWFASFTGAVSGSNDKDLAAMVKQLGGSLEATQAVVQVMLRLQTRKDRHLREFHSVLTDKLLNIQSDARTLDSNQRAVALELLSALQDQVEEQLRQYETVHRHERRLIEIDAALERTAEVERQFRDALSALDKQGASLRRAEAYLSGELEGLQRGLEALGTELELKAAQGDGQMRSIGLRLEAVESKRAEDLSSIFAEHEALRGAIESDRKMVESMAADLSCKVEACVIRVDALEHRCHQLEGRLGTMATWRGRLRQHWLSIMAVFIGMAAILLQVRS